MADIESRVRSICLALPGATERLSHGAPAFFVNKQFVMLWPEGHHEHSFPHLWCAAPYGAQAALLAAHPHRYFHPPYVGHRGWIGVRLDERVDWTEVAALCEDAFRTVAPKSYLMKLAERGSDDLA
ncbi:MAG: MmcQ/YjbR family DNA-binding protein [Acidimicrobiales bacterium]